jgi:hypothetical protein
MDQNIISYIIIAITFGVLFYRILQFFNLVEKKAPKCGGCSSGCALNEAHANKVKFGKKDPYQYYL